jgi:hypothetical protein
MTLLCSLNSLGMQGLFVYTSVVRCPQYREVRRPDWPGIAPECKILCPGNMALKQHINLCAMCAVTPPCWKQCSPLMSQHPALASNTTQYQVEVMVTVQLSSSQKYSLIIPRTDTPQQSVVFKVCRGFWIPEMVVYCYCFRNFVYCHTQWDECVHHLT